MDGESGRRTRVADYKGWVGIRGVCGCLPCSLCILGHLCGSLDLISTRFECLGVIMFFRKDRPQTEGRRDADPGIKTAPARASEAAQHNPKMQISGPANFGPRIATWANTSHFVPSCPGARPDLRITPWGGTSHATLTHLTRQYGWGTQVAKATDCVRARRVRVCCAAEDLRSDSLRRSRIYNVVAIRRLRH